ncbi:hypothetical protein NMY22_g10944 [Coprinellus aureogranulatus]|nr:hypothetical protein NMY22_g10944 [Coprinellus aureogranulatus]
MHKMTIALQTPENDYPGPSTPGSSQIGVNGRSTLRLGVSQALPLVDQGSPLPLAMSSLLLRYREYTARETPYWALSEETQDFESRPKVTPNFEAP